MKIERLKEWLSPETHMRDQRNSQQKYFDYHIIESKQQRKEIQMILSNVELYHQVGGSCVKLPPKTFAAVTNDQKFILKSCLCAIETSEH